MRGDNKDQTAENENLKKAMCDMRKKAKFSGKSVHPTGKQRERPC